MQMAADKKEMDQAKVQKGFHFLGDQIFDANIYVFFGGDFPVFYSERMQHVR